MRSGIVIFCAALLGAAIPGTAPQRIPLAAQRSSPQDLEVSGDVPGIPPGGKRFVGYTDLSRLAQVTFTVKNDENFSDPVTLSGVSLDVIMAALGIDGATQLIAAECRRRL